MIESRESKTAETITPASSREIIGVLPRDVAM